MKSNDKFGGCWILLGLMSSLMLCMKTLAADTSTDNTFFHGALVAEPCVILPGEESISLAFFPLLDTDLYLNKRTRGQQFYLHLTGCDISQVNTVRVMFSGNEDPALPGLLALASSSQASGIAIGLESSDGEFISLNQKGPRYNLLKGDNVFDFNAYVQGEPEAIAKKRIRRGAFRAIATFNVEYE
ncbi:fimbrial protein [Serratia rubidaea]|uniref:Fimbrial protein n=1 Tax=Serratia rubidaea TaxID=61652 RepID=A0ABS0MFT5_SERRU|nr:fimbrial protein [Serratia rubidaea]MBH1931209.1 fimbrial protein [Serratia rubidaea]